MLVPHFNRETATAVVKVLLGTAGQDDDGAGDTGGGEGRRVLFSPKDMLPNPAIPEYVWDAFDRLPSQTFPRKAARPVRRLTALVQALSRYGLRERALHDSYQRLFARLDGLVAEYAELVEENSDDGFIEIADDRAYKQNSAMPGAS